MIDYINSLDDLCAYWECKGEPWLLNKRVHNGTDCGASISLYYASGMALNNGSASAVMWSMDAPYEIHDESITWENPGTPIGFSIQTIVEGSDATVDSEVYLFGQITEEELGHWIEHMEAEAAFFWRRDNGELDDEDGDEW